MLLYNITGRTGVTIQPATIAHLWKNVHNIVGVINLSICLKWCDQCNTGAFINCHVFSPPKYSKIVGNTQYASPDPPECSYRDVIWKNLVITSKEKEGLR